MRIILALPLCMLVAGCGTSSQGGGSSTSGGSTSSGTSSTGGSSTTGGSAHTTGGSSTTTTTTGGSSSTTGGSHAQAPSGLQYAPNPATFPANTTMLSIPQIGGGAATSWTITPGLPSGVAINASTGIISGTPALTSPSPSPNVAYTITATNSAGSVSFSYTFNIGVELLTYPSFNPNLTVNVPVAPITPTLTGSTNTPSYAVTPSLPAGLTLSSSTGTIAGTPTASVALSTYTVSATTPTGTSYQTVSFAVSNYGNGTARTLVAGNQQAINSSAYVTDSSIAVGATSFNVDNATLFTVGDEIIVLQTQGSAGTAAYEHQRVLGINNNTITVAPMVNGYTSGNPNTQAATVTQIISVPNFAVANIPSGVGVVPAAFNGSSGGVIAFRSLTAVTIDGLVTADERGFRGGMGGFNGSAGVPGESYPGIMVASGSGNNGGGGGGGPVDNVCSNKTESAAAGGGYANAGGAGSPTGATLGQSYGAANLVNGFFLGSGGGGSGSLTSYSGLYGGNGAGSIFIAAPSVTVTASGEISAQGGGGGGLQTNEFVFASGGGSGGTIYIISDTLTVLGTLQAPGGPGSSVTDTLDSCTFTAVSGPGSAGRIRLDTTNAFTGTSNPAPGYTTVAP